MLNDGQRAHDGELDCLGTAAVCIILTRERMVQLLGGTRHKFGELAHSAPEIGDGLIACGIGFVELPMESGNILLHFQCGGLIAWRIRVSKIWESFVRKKARRQSSSRRRLHLKNILKGAQRGSVDGDKRADERCQQDEKVDDRRIRLGAAKIIMQRNGE